MNVLPRYNVFPFTSYLKNVILVRKDLFPPIYSPFFRWEFMGNHQSRENCFPLVPLSKTVLMRFFQHRVKIGICMHYPVIKLLRQIQLIVRLSSLNLLHFIKNTFKGVSMRYQTDQRSPTTILFETSGLPAETGAISTCQSGCFFLIFIMI